MYKLIHKSDTNFISVYYCETLEEALNLFNQVQTIIDKFSENENVILIDLDTGEIHISYERLFSPFFGTQINFYQSVELTRL